MPASKLELPVENPSALIRSRLREKRIFEARFLYRQLGAEIEEREKIALEQELSNVLTQVKKMQQQARDYTEKGQSHLAEKLYRDIEQLAIDVPGLAEDKQVLAGAEALLARMAGKTDQRKPEGVQAVPQLIAPPAAPSADETWAMGIPTTAKDRWQRLLWLLAGLLALALFLLLFFHPNHEALFLSAPKSPLPAQQLFIKPLDPVPPAPVIAAPSDKEAEPGESATEVESSPPASLKVGELQIKEAAGN